MLIKNTFNFKTGSRLFLTQPPGNEPLMSLFVDLQVTLPDDFDNNVEVTAIEVDYPEVFIRLSNRSGTLATVKTDTTGVPVRMDCIAGVTAHLLLGVIPNARCSYAEGVSLVLHPSRIHAYARNEYTNKSDHLYIKQDDVESYSGYLDRDIVVMTTHPELLLRTGDQQDGELMVVAAPGATARSLCLFNPKPELVPTYRAITSINHCGGVDVDVDVIISISAPAVATSAEMVKLNVSEHVVTIDTEGDEKFAPEDLIDKHLKPELGRELVYYPLDDAYVDGANIRDTFNQLYKYIYPIMPRDIAAGAGVYLDSPPPEFTLSEPGDLREIDPAYDKYPDED